MNLLDNRFEFKSIDQYMLCVQVLQLLALGKPIHEVINSFESALNTALEREGIQDMRQGDLNVDVNGPNVGMFFTC